MTAKFWFESSDDAMHTVCPEHKRRMAENHRMSGECPCKPHFIDNAQFRERGYPDYDGGPYRDEWWHH